MRYTLQKCKNYPDKVLQQSDRNKKIISLGVVKMQKEHMIIVVLSVVVLILSIVLVAHKKSEGYDNYYNLRSTMTPAQVSAALAQPACSTATQNYCTATATSQYPFSDNFAPQMSQVISACGSDFPVAGACSQTNPNYQLSPTNFIAGGNWTAQQM